MTKTSIIILAAGKGTRMKSEKPKVLHSVCGKAVIDYVVETAKAIGSDIYVVLGHQSFVVRRHLTSGVVSVVQKKLLGTADAIKAVKPYLLRSIGNVVILSGDAPLFKKKTIRRLVTAHKKIEAACTFLTAVMDEPEGYGRVIRDQSKNVISICEEKDVTRDQKFINEINVGVYCFNIQDLLEGLKRISINKKKKEYYLTDIVHILVQKKKVVKGVLLKDASEGLGINTRKDLAMANQILQKRILDNLMDQGVTIVDPLTTYIDVNVKIGKDTTIRPCTVIEKDVVIGKKCTIGPFCRIRPKTRIGNSVEIGNFTEVSRSTLGEKTFMKHFSFLGDTDVGKRVNIGAGVVTANYDGKNKSKTSIADDAFIGSDSILVAPVKIGKKAMTGAGCVVTKGKNIPDHSVVVGIPGRIKSKRKTK